jgi:hypothetical protein
MTTVSVPNLVVGHEYNFQCPRQPMRTGRLFRVITTGAGPQVQFHKVQSEVSPRTIVTVQGNLCTFTESLEGSMKAELSQKKGLPPNIERMLKQYGGKSRRQRRKRAMKQTRSRKN